MRVKAVLFDLDNTLIDFMKLKNLAVEQAIAAMVDAGLPMEKEKARELLVAQYRKYGIEYPEIFQRFLEIATGKIDWSILAAGAVAYRKVEVGFLEPYPHVVDVLLELKLRGYTLGIVSDATALKAWMRLSAMRLSKMFDFVITIDETKERKPSEIPFKKALEKLKLKPSEILFIGDSPKRDIAGAKAVGMKTALALYGTTEKQRRPSER